MEAYDHDARGGGRLASASGDRSTEETFGDLSPSSRGSSLGGSPRMAFLAAVVVLLKTNWGIGMMAMPYMIKSAGLVAGILLFVVSMIMVSDAVLRVDATQRALLEKQRYGYHPFECKTEGSIMVLSPSTDSKENGDGEKPKAMGPLNSGSVQTYVGIVEKGLGRWAMRLAVGCISLGTLGSCVAYSKFVQDNFHAYLGVSRWISGCVMAGVLVPLHLLDRMNAFALVSMFGLTFGFGFVFLLISKTILLPRHAAVGALSGAPAIKWETLPIAFGIAAFTSEGIVVMFPPLSHAKMQDMKEIPQGYKIDKRLAATMAIFTVAYLIVACCGYVLYGDDVKAEVTLNMNDHDDHLYILSQVASLLYSLSLVMTCVVVAYTCFSSYEAFLRSYAEGAFQVNSPVHGALPFLFIFLRCLFPVVCGLIAYFVPNFGAFLSLIGALMNSVIVYLLPNLLFLYNAPSGKGHRIWCWFMVFYSVLTGAVGTGASLWQFIHS